MMKIAIVFGTRPEAIKLAPIIHEIKSNPKKMEATVIVTSQHKEMLKQVLDLFKIKPDFDLNIMKHDQDLFDISIRILNGIKNIFIEIEPDMVLVQGDTSTTFLSALAAYYLKIKIGHVEAGLRTFNKYSPFPEEMNRCMVSNLADYHFAPTEIAMQNLINENIKASKIITTGNTSIDALFWVVDNVLPARESSLKNKYHWLQDKEKSILVTVHRRENFGAPLLRIIDAIKTLHEQNPDISFTIPVHMNPNVRNIVHEHLCRLPRVNIIDPVSYEEFVYLIKSSYIVLTDSGGIQEEAPSLGKPVLILRNTTERPEGISAGTNLLIGTDKDKIVEATTNLFNNTADYKRMAEVRNPFGDGRASKKIISWISNMV